MNKQRRHEASSADLRALGRLLDEATTRPSPFQREASFKELEKALRSRASLPPAKGVYPWLAALASAGALAAACWLLVFRSADLQFEVQGGEVSEGTYVRQLDREAPASLLFSEGTRVEFAASARGRLLDVSPVGASFLLEQGRVELDVTPRLHASWSVVVGPFRVDVLGTNFSVAWEPNDEQLEVVVTRGRVRIEGPDAKGVVVRSGQRFRAWLGATRANMLETYEDRAVPVSPEGRRAPDPRGLADVGEAEPALAGSTASATTAQRRDEIQSAPASPGSGQIVNGKPWSAKVASGNYAEVLAEAERSGLDKVLSTASRSDVMALADAARYSRRLDLAERALRTVRSRFAGTSDATAAAFLLGRLVEDANPQRASQLYDAASREAPGGPLRGEILGRRMILAQRMNRWAESRRLADEYLKVIPKGPYADKARTLTAQPSEAHGP